VNAIVAIHGCTRGAFVPCAHYQNRNQSTSRVTSQGGVPRMSSAANEQRGIRFSRQATSQIDPLRSFAGPRSRRSQNSLSRPMPRYRTHDATRRARFSIHVLIRRVWPKQRDQNGEE
jgi:hypothetical protein